MDYAYDLVIRGGEVFDGSGRPGRKTDIAIQAGRIAAIGPISGRGREEIDARCRRWQGAAASGGRRCGRR